MRANLGAVTQLWALFFFLSIVVQASIVKHHWTLSPSYTAPDGHYRMTFEVNGQSPGPTLEGNEGDSFEIEIRNRLPVEMTIHWHGIFQRNSPLMDGVPGINQWANPPRGNYTYKFSATGQYGLHWYHAHVRGYLDDGVKGLIYIYPNASRPRPFSKISSDQEDIDAMMEAEKKPRRLALYDWRHVQEDEALTMFYSSGRPTTCVDSVLFNGKGRSFCPTPEYLNVEADGRFDALPFFASQLDQRGCLVIPGTGVYNAEAISSPMGCSNSTTPVEIIPTQGNWTMFNVANVGGEWTWALSIDQHDIWIIAADGDYIEPKKVQVLPVSIGQRYTIVVPTNKTEGGDYYIRAASQGFAQVLGGVGLLRYADDMSKRQFEPRQDPVQASENGFPMGDPWSDLSSSSLHYNSTVFNGAYQFNPQVDAPAYPPLSPPRKSDMTLIFHANQTNTTVFQIASQPLSDVQELNLPILFQAAEHNEQMQDPAWLYRLPYGATVDVIMQNAANALFPAPAEPPHPIHLHGHKYWVLGSKEYETWNFSSIDEAVQSGKVNLNFENPPYRDTFLLPTAGWLALRFVADNPGAWLMHCHISSHLQAGMGIVFLEAPDRLGSIPESYRIPPTTTSRLIRGLGPMMGMSM